MRHDNYNRYIPEGVAQAESDAMRSHEERQITDIKPSLSGWEARAAEVLRAAGMPGDFLTNLKRAGWGIITSDTIHLYCRFCGELKTENCECEK
jgi:hypothetical protein